MKALIAAALLSLALPAAADESRVRFYGYAYDLKTDAYLYTEVHDQRIVDGKWLGGSITYFAPDGSEMARKTLDFSQDEFVPVYRLDQRYNGYNEGISAAGADIQMFKQKSATARSEKDSVAKTKDMAADSGFHLYLREHFQELMQGKTVEFRFVVAGNLDTFKFRARKTGETQFEGKPAVKILVEANSLLRMVAPSLEMTYEPQQRQLLEYRGVSNIHDPRTGKAYDARIAYYSTPPAGTPKLPPLQ